MPASFAISNYITVVYLLVDDYKLLRVVMKILNGAYLAVKSAWSLVTPTTIANCYRNAGFVHGDAPFRAESGAQVESNPESELRTFTNIWDVLNSTMGEMLSLQDYIDVDNQVDCTERMTDQEIVAQVLNDRLNPESDNDDQLSETPIDEPEPIPTTTQAIRAIDCIRQFTLSMDDNTSITEDTLQLTTILEQKPMHEKALRSKQTIITQYFRPKDMKTALLQSRCNVCVSSQLI